jgi:tRNA N6-adenosine threonylcarbamoyltransferase
MTLVLSVETSCDETGVALVEDGRRIVSNVVASQTAHERTGGIVPEVAAREHLRQLDPITAEALRRGRTTLADVDAVAATVGPGLIGALLVGANYARGLAFASEKRFIGVNHLEGHVYANWLYEGTEVPPEPELPAVVLVVSGAHSDLVLMEGHLRFRPLGRTIDDAAGEAYDKVARLLGLGFPGGPLIERAARDGDPRAFAFPKAELSGRYDVSFSGLKTAVLRCVRELERRSPGAQTEAAGRGRASLRAQGPLPLGPSGGVPPTEGWKNDLAASFQRTVNEMLAERVARAAAEFDARTVMLGGGVAANVALREEIVRRVSLPLRVPPPKLCTDNGAMIGAAAFFSMRHRSDRIPMLVRSGLALAQREG